MMQFVLQVPDKTIKHKVFRKEISWIPWFITISPQFLATWNPGQATVFCLLLTSIENDWVKIWSDWFCVGILVSMALPVREFQDQGYKIRKIFAKKSTYPKEIIEFWELDWVFWVFKVDYFDFSFKIFDKLMWIRCQGNCLQLLGFWKFFVFF